MPRRKALKQNRKAGPAGAGRPRVGISSCLLGENVRYDGGHKRNARLLKALGPCVEWAPVCPEVEMGLGTPRDTLILVRKAGQVRLVMPKTGADYTAKMRAYARRRVAQLAEANLSGFILKKNSPSCGRDGVKLYDSRGVASSSGRGLFAEALLARFPDLPVEEEGRLADPRVLEDFKRRVLAYRRRGPRR